MPPKVEHDLGWKNIGFIVSYCAPLYKKTVGGGGGGGEGEKPRRGIPIIEFHLFI